MKLPYLIRPTLMPASRAPSWLSPVAIVCSPQLVLVSTTWKIATRMTAQMNCDHGLVPIQSPKPAVAGGIVLGSACEV